MAAPRHNLKVQPIMRRESAFSLRKFLEHGNNFIRDSFAGPRFGVAVVACPNLITAQLVPFEIGQISDPVIRQLRDISMPKGGTIFYVETQLSEVLGGYTGDRHVANQENLQPGLPFLPALGRKFLAHVPENLDDCWAVSADVLLAISGDGLILPGFVEIADVEFERSFDGRQARHRPHARSS